MTRKAAGPATLIGLSVVILFTGGALYYTLSSWVERSSLRQMAAANAWQAGQLSKLLVRQLEAGAPRSQVREMLQQSLSDGAGSSGQFVCLLDRQDKVLCHPRPEMIGMSLARLELRALDGRRLPPGSRLGPGLVVDAGSRQAAQIVHRTEVPAGGWILAVHSELAPLQAHLRQLRRSLLWILVPAGIVLALFGSLTVERIRRRAERELDTLVARRTEELAQIHTRYAALFEAAPSAIFVCGGDGRILECNEQARTLTGRPAGELIGRPIDELIERRPAADSGAVVEAVLAGSDRVLQVHERQVGSGFERMRQLIVPDVTELRALERQLRRSAQLAALGRLAGGVAHDMNNMLSVVLGTAELALVGQDGSGSLAADLREIAAAAQRGAGLTRQLLQFARQDAMVPEVLDLCAEIRALRRRASRRRSSARCGPRPASRRGPRTGAVWPRRRSSRPCWSSCCWRSATGRTTALRPPRA